MKNTWKYQWRIVLFWKKYPKLRDIIEDEVGHPLTREESNMLAKYIKNSVDLMFIDYKEIFFKGYKEAYYYFVRSNLLEKM